MRQFFTRALPKPIFKSQRFIGAWIRSPFKVGAVLPSSRALSRAMAEQIDRDKPGLVIELGAGTGAVTNALAQLGLENDRLVIVERDQALASFLVRHFPQLNVVCKDAADLDQIVAEYDKKTRVNAVVSSLPLLSLPRVLRLSIEEAMVEHIGEHGKIIQFTYGPRSPISRRTVHKYGLSAKRVKTVVANVPPAHVWVYQKA